MLFSGAPSHVELVPSIDKWRYKLASDGNFYSSHLRSLINSRFTTHVDNPTKWVHLAPIKDNGFIWSACLDQIPSIVALSRQGVSISSSICQFCSTGMDVTNHIPVGCPFAKDGLRWILNWCNIPI